MTTLMIIVVGILGTVFLSFAAYKHWSDVAPTPRLNPIGIVGNRKFRIKWRWSWFWWAIGIGYLVIAYHYYPWEQLETGGKLQSLDPKSKVPARLTENSPEDFHFTLFATSINSFRGNKLKDTPEKYQKRNGKDKKNQRIQYELVDFV